MYPAEMTIEKRFDWSEEEAHKWHETCLLEEARNSHFMPGAVEVVKKLQEMGHETYIITARGGYIKEMKEAALEKFEEKNLKFDGYYFQVKDKGELCQEIGIDILIDDAIKNCRGACEKGVKTLYFRDIGMDELKNDLSFEVHNWGEIYKYFKLNQ